MTDNAEEFMRKLRATFHGEAAELVQAIVSELVQLERDRAVAPGPAAQRILKTLHTLKGAARAVDLNELELLCHAMEGMCTEWSARVLEPDAAQFDLLHQACSLAGQLAGQPSGRIRNQALSLAHAIEALAARAPEAPAVETAAPAAIPEAAAVQTVGEAAGAHGADEGAAPARQDSLRIEGRDLDTIRYHAEALLSVELELQHQAAHLQELAAQLLQEGAGASAAPFFESVRQAAGGTHRASARLGAIRARLMEKVLDAAMVPVSTVLEPFPAMVRNLARSRGKEAALLVEGDALRIDRRILETVRETLLHLLTNAVDHGIEPAAQRLAAGKPAQGQVRIAVEPAGSDRVRLTVADDGAGIDTGAVVAAAALPDEQLAGLGPQERMRLVLRAGVSTTSAVTPVSGRGIGLAIVADKVSGLGGQLLLESASGQGCRFELVLPVRVANLRALVVRCGDAEYALPLQGLEAVQALEDDAVLPVQGRETLGRDGRVLPLVRLGRLLGQPDGAAAPGRKAVIARAGGTVFALAVDEILSEQAIVPKSLGRQLRRIRYFSGATQLGDGALLPVLALDDIARHALGTGVAGVPAAPEAARSSARRVLAVEDSLTSRLLLKHILEGAGFEVAVAADGLDAQSLLRRERFDAVVSDVEMPRLDGLALTRSIRENPQTRELPVVLVTSLQSAEERERGMLAGADAYVVKGAFDQDNLLATLRRLM